MKTDIQTVLIYSYKAVPNFVCTDGLNLMSYLFLDNWAKYSVN